jgi:hypothetical protein
MWSWFRSKPLATLAKPAPTQAHRTLFGTAPRSDGPNTTWPKGKMTTRRSATARSPTIFVAASRRGCRDPTHTPSGFVRSPRDLE